MYESVTYFDLKRDSFYIAVKYAFTFTEWLSYNAIVTVSNL